MERKAEGQHLYVQGSPAQTEEVLARVLEKVPGDIVVPLAEGLNPEELWERRASKRPTMAEDELTAVEREHPEGCLLTAETPSAKAATQSDTTEAM